MIKLTPTFNEMLQEKLPLDNGAAVPLHVNPGSPDNESAAVPVTVIVEPEAVDWSSGEVTTRVGIVLSIFSVTLAEAWFPPVSVTVPVMT
jgi:hypothetical protein